jgi:signal peptidase II
VRDFLDFYIGDHHWPAFNVADSMLCIAVALIMLHSIFTKPEEEVEK